MFCCEMSMTGEHNMRVHLLASLSPTKFQFVSSLGSSEGNRASPHPKEYRRAAAGKSGLGNPDERNRIRLATSGRLKCRRISRTWLFIYGRVTRTVGRLKSNPRPRSRSMSDRSLSAPARKLKVLSK